MVKGLAECLAGCLRQHFANSAVFSLVAVQITLLEYGRRWVERSASAKPRWVPQIFEGCRARRSQYQSAHSDLRRRAKTFRQRRLFTQITKFFCAGHAPHQLVCCIVTAFGKALQLVSRDGICTSAAYTPHGQQRTAVVPVHTNIDAPFNQLFPTAAILSPFCLSFFEVNL